LVAVFTRYVILPKHAAEALALWVLQSLADSPIIVTMSRKKKSETVERLRRSDNDDFAILRRQAWRWCEDNLKILTTADPAVPDTLNDRAADNWRPSDTGALETPVMDYRFMFPATELQFAYVEGLWFARSPTSV